MRLELVVTRYLRSHRRPIAPRLVGSGLRKYCTSSSEMQPSAEPAHDFINFLNASPTRTDCDFGGWDIYMLTVESFPCCPLSQAAAFESRIRGDQSMLVPLTSIDSPFLPILPLNLIIGKGSMDLALQAGWQILLDAQ